MTFSEKLVKLRKLKGLTQDEFASAIGVSRQAVYKWECGQSYPEVPKLIEMKKLFGISLDDLLDTGKGTDDVAIGFCKNCGISINEKNLGTKEPVVLCRRCVEVNKAQQRREEMKAKALTERQEKAQRARRMAEYNAFKDRQKTIRKKKALSFFIAAIPTLLWLAYVVYTQLEEFNQTWSIVGAVIGYCIFSFVALLFYDGPVRDLLVYMCTASIKWPGLVYTFDWDGFLWVIAMKALFMIIGFVFGLLCGILGIVLGLLIAPFVFPYKLIKMSYDIRHADLTDYVS